MNSATTNIQRRRRTERYFVIAGAGAVSLALLFLLILFADIGLTQSQRPTLKLDHSLVKLSDCAQDFASVEYFVASWNGYKSVAS